MWRCSSGVGRRVIAGRSFSRVKVVFWKYFLEKFTKAFILSDFLKIKNFVRKRNYRKYKLNFLRLARRRPRRLGDEIQTFELWPAPTCRGGLDGVKRAVSKPLFLAMFFWILAASAFPGTGDDMTSFNNTIKHMAAKTGEMWPRMIGRKMVPNLSRSRTTRVV